MPATSEGVGYVTARHAIGKFPPEPQPNSIEFDGFKPVAILYLSLP
jgi:hypothetical protein